MICLPGATNQTNNNYEDNRSGQLAPGGCYHVKSLNYFLMINSISAAYKTDDICVCFSDVITLHLNRSDITDSRAITVNPPSTREKGEQGDETETESDRGGRESVY